MASTDKRSVSTDALETLGTIIGTGQGRDAIHLAVEPVEAGERLVPGQKIGLIDGKAFNKGAKHLGIVDPFLTASVAPGEHFWLVVFPRQITSLRHVWSHPDFAEEGAPTPPSDRVAASRKWIEDLADRVDITYRRLMSGAEDWRVSQRRDGWGDYITGGSEMEGTSVPDEFWTHYEIVTGESVPDKERGSFFSCSC